MERTELEKSLAAFAEANALDGVQIGFSRHTEGHEWFTLTAHWDNAPIKSGRGCTIAHGKTIAEAIAKARTQIADQRAVTIADEAIPVEKAA